MKVGEHQFGIYHVGVCQRIDLAGDMGDLIAFKTTEHVGNRRDLADVPKKLIAQSFALARAGNQACDIEELQLRRNKAFRLGQPCDYRHAFIGYRYPTGIGLDRAERVIGGFCRRRCRQGIE